MVDNVLKIKSLGVDQILNDPVNIMLLLRTYSELFLNGKQPGNCNSCIRKYYNQIILKGEKMANIKKDQTFVMSFEGVKFVPAVKKNGKLIMIHKHINPKFVTDKEAIKMLELGALSGKDFKVLPKGYKGNQKPKGKEFSIEDLEAVLENEDFNHMRAVVVELGIDAGKNPKAEKLKEVIIKAVDKLKK